MPLGFIAESVDDDARQVADHLLVGAGHAAFAAGGRGGESLNGLVDPVGYTLRGGGIVSRDVVEDAAEIVVGVLCKYGASNSRDPRRNRDALQRFAAPLEVSSFDRAATEAYVRIRTVLERKGWPIGPMDLLIAAHALSLGVRLVTNDEGEFKRVPGLVVENWF